jgi:glycosyltransferase involved in cell wall biosynthesis
MKIVHLTWALNLGGLETMLVNIVNSQVAYADVTLIVINNACDKDLIGKIDEKVEVIFLNRNIKSSNKLAFLRLNYILLRKRPNIIHSHAPRIGMVLFPLIYKNKLFYTVHDVGIDSKYFKYYNKNHIIAISKSVQEDLNCRLQIRSQLIYNGILLENIKKKNSEKINDTFKIIQISRLMHEKKGQHILIEAISLLKQSGFTNIQLDIIGEGESEKYLKTLIEDNCLDNIKLLGSKSYSYINEHLCDYDLLVQPSLFEGFGLTVTEAMAAKVPVLVSNIDGPMEIIDKGCFGYFFNSGDHVDCAKMINVIMVSDNKVLVEKAYSRVMNDFNVNKTAKKYFDYYLNCLK